MTREEREQAIAILENEKKCVNRANKNDYCNRDCYNCELVKTDTEILTALDMAILALEQEPCEDTISRQAVLDLPRLKSRNVWGEVIYESVDVEDVKQLPSVKPQESSRDMEEIEEIINCDANAEIKCKMISNILTAKPHYFEEQEPKTDKVIKMRDATPEEQKSVDDYIKSISKPTGINFWDLDGNDDCISRKAVLSLLADHFDNVFDMVKELPSVAIPPDHDGCKDCKYETYPEYYYPCCDCKQNYVDKWQKKPHWIDTGSGQECSECHEIQYGYDNHRFYCGNCGAKMN